MVSRTKSKTFIIYVVYIFMKHYVQNYIIPLLLVYIVKTVNYHLVNRGYPSLYIFYECFNIHCISRQKITSTAVTAKF